ncbi:hypothetical protein PR048_015646 [Dryococelus australis]|uniref:Uncharacterized protein n=1 Tax=Dryococelus australis TaxID=614101 RepID=A0ABQ9HHR1_9NEOP|nr:hypothetical protein PR048_015646 [Dryococelus australis]
MDQVSPLAHAGGVTGRTGIMTVRLRLVFDGRNNLTLTGKQAVGVGQPHDARPISPPEKPEQNLPNILFCQIASKTDNFIRTPIQVNNIPCRVLVDMVASHNFIHITSEIMVTARIRDIITTMMAYVYNDIKDDVILGIPGLSEQKAVVEPAA